MMLRLTQITQYCFCLVSMVLTGLFALSLSGLEWSNLLHGDNGYQKLLAASLFVLIGCCIDIGKYLFWYYRRRSYWYGCISLILTAFSLLASCAFFISGERSLIEDTWLQSPEHRSLQQRIDAIQIEIDQQERLLEIRLSSQYHSQWSEAEKNSDKVSKLRIELAEVEEKAVIAGNEAARENVPVTQFYAAISQLLGVTQDLTRILGYGLLSLLLEVSTLGAVSLSRSLANELTVTEDLAVEFQSNQPKNQDKIAQLTQDILIGKIEPVIRKIRSAKYGLNIEEIREVLKAMCQAGSIKKDKRNSYRLSLNNE